MKYIGTKTIETKRLILRKVKLEDAYQAYENWCHSNIVDRYVLWKKHKSVNETLSLYTSWLEEYKNPKTFRWIVELKNNKDVIGTIDVSKKYLDYGTCSIGYCYGEKYWNQGYATEALLGVMKYLFLEAEADTIYAEHLHLNPASGKVMQKVGMKYEGTLRSRIIDKQGFRNDLISYSITRDEYLNKMINN